MEIIDLEMIPGGPKKTCHTSQFDNGRVIRFNLKENGQPFALSGTETVQAIIRKPDGSETTLDIANTSSTYVDLITEADTCDIAGVNHCEMKVTEDGEDLGSGNFDMKVEEDAYGAGDVSVGTASGPIASFETDIKDDLIECICEINPVQDLHGEDKPYPAGGGVNLFDKSTVVNGYIDDADGELKSTSGTAYRSSDYISVEASESYYIKTEQTGGLCGAWYDINKVYISGLTAYKNTVKTAPNNAAYVRLTVVGTQDQGGNIDTFAFNYPATDTQYHPYENACPIEGHTEMDIIRSGVNIWNEEWELGTIDIYTGQDVPGTSNIRSKGYIPCKPNTTYLFNRGSFAGNVFEYDSNKSFIQLDAGATTFTTTANTRYLRFYMGAAYGTTYNNDISINYPATDTAYHPAEIIEKNIQLGQTVYRARINITTGEMLLIFKYKSLGDLNWGYNSGYGFYTSKDSSLWGEDKPKGFPNNEKASLICTHYKTETYAHTTAGTYNGTIAQGVTYMAISDNRFTDAQAFKNAMSSVYIAYELANPETIQLTPKQIETLVGQKNNVYHNANGDTAVKFYTRA